jgi:diguanylate cyclase
VGWECSPIVILELKGSILRMLVLEDFFINFCILCTGIFIIHHYFRRGGIRTSAIGYKLRGGMLYGIFGVILMHFGIHLNNGVLIDLRSVPIMICAYVGGWVPTAVSAAIIIIFRLVLYPISFSSLNNIYVLGVSAVIFCVICRAAISMKKKWVWMPLAFIIILASTFYLVIPELKKGLIIFVQYTFAIVMGAVGTYCIKSYLARNDENYEKFKKASEKDHLTGLNNVRTFDQRINSLFSKAKGQDKEMSLLMIDIDHFKLINDTYGHPAGDRVIMKVAELLMMFSRPHDVVSRNGGEEFSIIMPDCDSYSCEVRAEKIRQAIEKSTFVLSDKKEIQATISLGWATTIQQNINSVAQLIAKADAGLYQSKQTGRNRVTRGI